MTLTAEPTRTHDLAGPDEWDIDALRARVAGRIVLPGELDWDESRQAWNLAVDQRPFAVALVESAEDVVEVVAFACLHGLRVAPQGTGHGAGSLADLADTILVKTTRLRGVEIDAVARRARIEAGAIWGDVVEPAAQQGFVVLHGSSPDVGVVGYTLGGGMGWLARSRGLAANSVTEVEIVTADGTLVRADREHDPDLFWAVRGGGGSFGIVTAIELELYEAAELYAGAMFWPGEQAGEVLRAWRDWAETVPDEVTSVGRILHFPPVPEIPEALRGGSFAVVEAVFTGPESEGATLVAPLRELGPVIDTFASVAPAALQHLHMDPPHPVPGSGDGIFLDELPSEAIDAIAETGVPPLLTLEIRHLGGAMATPSESHGAVGSLEAGYVMFAAGLTMTPELGTAVGAAVDRAKAALAPWESERTYFNFSERRVDAARLYPAETYTRLRRIKRRYDPDQLFVANHPITPEGRTMTVGSEHSRTHDLARPYEKDIDAVRALVAGPIVLSGDSDGDDFDLVVIGSGPAGEKGANQAAYHGYRVAVVERRAKVGGGATAVSGVPVKALRDTAVYLTGWSRRDTYGVGISPAPDLTLNRLRDRVDEVVATTTEAVRQNLERHGVELVHGDARLGPDRSVIVRGPDGAERTLRARVILLATGSRPYHPPDIPFEDPDVHDSDTVLSIERLPERILVIGGGPVGCEYASIFSALGVEVTLVDRGTRLLPLLDHELSEALVESLRKSGARLILEAQVESLGRDAEGLVVRVDGEDLRPQVVLHASGRTGNVEGLGLAEAGVEVDARGRIRVDQGFRTTSGGIYAAGDIVGPPGLASVSMEQARVAMCRAFDIPLKQSVDSLVPTGIYTLPEVGMVGLTEQAARASGEDVETGRALFAANPRARIAGTTEGLVKLVFRTSDHRLLGAHILGEEATELIHIAHAMLHAGATVREFIDATFNFPSRADAYKYAAYDALQRLETRPVGQHRRPEQSRPVGTARSRRRETNVRNPDPIRPTRRRSSRSAPK